MTNRLLLVASVVALSFPAHANRTAPQRYTLVISGPQPIKIDYPNERACLAAKAAILAQFAPTQRLPNGGIIYSTPPVVFCVPR